MISFIWEWIKIVGFWNILWYIIIILYKNIPLEKESTNNYTKSNKRCYTRNRTLISMSKESYLWIPWAPKCCTRVMWNYFLRRVTQRSWTSSAIIQQWIITTQCSNSIIYCKMTSSTTHLASPFSSQKLSPIFAS